MKRVLVYKNGRLVHSQTSDSPTVLAQKFVTLGFICIID